VKPDILKIVHKGELPVSLLGLVFERKMKNEAE